MANYNPYANNYMPYGMNYNMYNNPSYQTNNQFNQYAYVNGIEGAKSFQMQPNQTMMLMDSDSPMCYMKSTNNIGQATLRYFKLVEVTESDLKPTATKVNPDYVLKSDFDALAKRLDDLIKEKESK